MYKKIDSPLQTGRKLSSGCQLELALVQHELGTATVIQFPIKPMTPDARIADAKRRLLEFAERLPE